MSDRVLPSTPPAPLTEKRNPYWAPDARRKGGGRINRFRQWQYGRSAGRSRDTASRATMARQLRALQLGVIALPAGNPGPSGSGNPQRGWM